MVVRAKFRITEQTNKEWGKEILGSFIFVPVTSDGCEENKQFWKWTPTGKIELGTVNPEILKEFEIGKEYYVDFTPAE